MDQIEEVQNTVQGVLSIILLGSGLVLSIMGLFLWLAGLRSIRFYAGLAMAGVGFWIASVYFSQSLYALVLTPVIFGVAAMLLKKTAGAILGVICAGLLGILVFTAPTLTRAEFWQFSDSTAAGSGQDEGKFGAIDRVKMVLNGLSDKYDKFIKTVPAMGITAFIICIIGASVLAMFKPLWIAAVFTSMIGTMQIVCGAVLLCLYKGIKPYTYLDSYSGLIGWGFAGMVLLGAFVQAAIIKEKKKKEKAPDAESIVQGE